MGRGGGLYGQVVGRDQNGTYVGVPEREDEGVGLPRRMRREEREEAGEAATGWSTMVRAKVDRFMTVVSDKSKSGVTD